MLPHSKHKPHGHLTYFETLSQPNLITYGRKGFKSSVSRDHLNLFSLDVVICPAVDFISMNIVATSELITYVKQIVENDQDHLNSMVSHPDITDYTMNSILEAKEINLIQQYEHCPTAFSLSQLCILISMLDRVCVPLDTLKPVAEQIFDRIDTSQQIDQARSEIKSLELFHYVIFKSSMNLNKILHLCELNTALQQQQDHHVFKSFIESKFKLNDGKACVDSGYLSQCKLQSLLYMSSINIIDCAASSGHFTWSSICCNGIYLYTSCNKCGDPQWSLGCGQIFD